MKKWMLLLMLTLFAALFVSCAEPSVTTADNANTTTTEPEVTTTPAPTVYTAPVAVDGVSDYVIVYDGSNATVKSEVTKYVSKMKSKFGITLKAEDIAKVSEPYAHEIIVGDLEKQRPTVASVKAGCKTGDFTVSVTEEGVVFYATDDFNYMYLFAALLAEEGLKPENKTLTYSSDKNYYHHASSLKDMNYAEYVGKDAALTQAFVESLFTYHETKTATGQKLVYRLYLPSDYDADKEYPLLLVLHGAGERGVDNQKQLVHMIRTMFNQNNSPVDDAIVICPQCPENQQWVDTPWANGNYRTADIPESDELAAVVKVVEGIRDSYSVDKNRIYAMGLSMGGFGTWDLLVRHADLFAAGVPICGGGDQTKAKELAKMPIYTFHGSADGVVPPSGTKMMAMMINKNSPVDFHYEEFEGAGHDIWNTVAGREDVFEWLFSRTKAKS